MQTLSRGPSLCDADHTCKTLPGPTNIDNAFADLAVSAPCFEHLTIQHSPCVSLRHLPQMSPPNALRCSTCGEPNHTSLYCPTLGDDTPARKFAIEARRLLALEPAARSALMHGVPLTSPICAQHRQRGLDKIRVEELTNSNHVASILQHRALMPTCWACALGWFREMGNPVWPFDTCTCAATVFDDKTCAWCALADLQQRRKDYIAAYRRLVPVPDIKGGQPTTQPMLLCACGKWPMWPYEVLRVCAGCHGAVTVPLHALDGVTHLACTIGKPSRRLVGEGESMNIQLTGSRLECIAHPMRPLVQSLGEQQVFLVAKRAQDLARAKLQSLDNGHTPGKQTPGNGQPPEDGKTPSMGT